MGLVSQQAVITVQVEMEKYGQADAAIREKLQDYPDCRIVAMASDSASWGTWFFVTIETI